MYLCLSITSSQKNVYEVGPCEMIMWVQANLESSVIVYLRTIDLSEPTVNAFVYNSYVSPGVNLVFLN